MSMNFSQQIILINPLFSNTVTRCLPSKIAGLNDDIVKDKAFCVFTENVVLDMYFQLDISIYQPLTNIKNICKMVDIKGEMLLPQFNEHCSPLMYRLMTFSFSSRVMWRILLPVCPM